MTCRRVNKMNINKRAAIDLFYRKGNLKGLMLSLFENTALCVVLLKNTIKQQCLKYTLSEVIDGYFINPEGNLNIQ